MTRTGDPIAWLAMSGFLVLFVGVVGLGLRHARRRKTKIQAAAAARGWSIAGDPAVVDSTPWIFRRVRGLGKVRDVAIRGDEVALGVYATAFTALRRARASDVWHAVALARTPLSLRTPLVFEDRVPATPAVVARLFQRVSRPPEVAVDDDALAARWAVYADDPEAAAVELVENASLRRVMASIQRPVEGEVAGRWSVPFPEDLRSPRDPASGRVFVEFRGDRMLVATSGRNDETRQALSQLAEAIVRALPRDQS